MHFNFFLRDNTVKKYDAHFCTYLFHAEFRVLFNTDVPNFILHIKFLSELLLFLR